MNSEYKRLARERTVLLALEGLAREFLLPLEGEEEPTRRLECEELARHESGVPEDVVIDVVLKLQRLAKNRELEMSKYTHVLAERNDEQEWTTEEKSPTQAGAKGPGTQAGKGKSKGSGAHPPPAATGRGGQKPTHSGAQAAGAAPSGRS